MFHRWYGRIRGLELFKYLCLADFLLVPIRDAATAAVVLLLVVLLLFVLLQVFGLFHLAVLLRLPHLTCLHVFLSVSQGGEWILC